MKQKRSSTTLKKAGVATRKSILGKAPAKAAVPEKWAGHFRTLNALKDRLIADSKNLRMDVIQPLESHSEDIADSATDEFDHDMALSELSGESYALNEVNEAIGRILNGTYGICEDSGKPIAALRLKVIPWTRFSKGAAERREKEGLGARVHFSKPSSVHGKPKTIPPAETDPDVENEVPLPEDETLHRIQTPGRPSRRRRPK